MLLTSDECLYSYKAIIAFFRKLKKIIKQSLEIVVLNGAVILVLFKLNNAD